MARAGTGRHRPLPDGAPADRRSPPAGEPGPWQAGASRPRRPDPSAARTVEEFVALLRLLKVWAGDPSFEELRRRSRVPSSTLADALSATRARLPRLELVRAFVRACGGTREDLVSWASAWRRIQADLLSGAPPRPGAAAPPRQLPRDVPHFVGRRDAVDRLDRVHQEHTARLRGSPLVLVVGAAGIGKSALALHWAHRMVDAYPDGQLYVDLHGARPAPRTTAGEVLPLLLRAIGVPDGDIPVATAARASLYRSLTFARRMLVVLDNVRDADQVRPLLPGGPVCLTLVTSRSRLSGLVARDGGTRLALAPLDPGEAQRLIALSLGDERGLGRSEATRQLARLCGYVPLALRIAAANLADRPHGTVSEHVARLASESRLAELLLAGDAAAAVRSCFDPSYAALDEPAQRLFRRLAAAPEGRITARGAAALAAVPLARARSRLDALAAINLLEPAGSDAYTMNAFVRLYAAQVAGDRAAFPATRRARARRPTWLQARARAG